MECGSHAQYRNSCGASRACALRTRTLMTPASNHRLPLASLRHPPPPPLRRLRLDEHYVPPVHAKTAEEAAELSAVLGRHILFGSAPEEARRVIVAAMERREYAAGDVIIKQVRRRRPAVARVSVWRVSCDEVCTLGERSRGVVSRLCPLRRPRSAHAQHAHPISAPTSSCRATPATSTTS